MKKILLLSLLFVSCNGGNQQTLPKELKLVIHSEPPTLDPRKAHDTTSCHVLKMCFEGLTALNAQGSPELAIAEKVEGADTEYLFTLKPTRWSDGTPLTAFDFEKTWKTMLSPSFPCHFAIDLYPLKNAKDVKEGKLSLDALGVQALDDKTLKITLEHPTPYLLTLLACHSFLPVASHVSEKQIPFVSNGPLKLTQWHHHQDLILEKNPMYWDEKAVKIDRVNFSVVEDETTQLSMFENDELDWAGCPFSKLPLDALASLKKKYGIKSLPLAAIYYYSFNTTTFPFHNVNLRKAFALAINRKEIVENILQEGQIPATGYLPPMTGSSPSSYFKDADLEEAKRLFHLGLTELGVTLEQISPIRLSYNTLDSHHKLAQAIQEQWSKAFGIKVELNNMDWKVFLDTLQKHEFQVARMGASPTFNDPVTFLDTFKYAQQPDYTGWSNFRFTEVLEKADNTLDPNKRMGYLKQAEQILMDEMPIVPIYFYTQSYLKKPHIKGELLSDMGEIDIKSIYMEGR